MYNLNDNTIFFNKNDEKDHSLVEIFNKDLVDLYEELKILIKIQIAKKTEKDLNTMLDWKSTK